MEIKKYTALIWQWAWLIILGVVVAGGAAYIVNKNITPVYSANAKLLIDEAPGSESGNEYAQILTAQRLSQTYMQIMKTTPVLEETIDRLNLSLTPGQLAGKVQVSAPDDTQILVIRIEDTDPVRAAEIANMLGTVFIELNQARESLRYAEPIANWEARLEDASDTITELETQLNRLSVSETPEDVASEDVASEEITPEEMAAISLLQTQLNEAQIRYTEAFNNLNSLQVSQAKESSNLVPIEPAVPNNNPIRPRTSTNTLLAAVVGGMLALGIIFLIEYLDDTIKNPNDVTESTGLTTLGAIAVIPNENHADRLITHITPRDPISEAYRVLRTNLGFSAVDGGLNSMLITSSSPGEGKSTTIANLAIVMAQTGKRVILIDADMRRPMQHKIFEVTNNRGLTTAILDNQSDIINHIQQTKISNLSLMSSGPVPPNPAELLNSHRMSQVIEALGNEFDLMLFDTPPALTVADASILANQVDGAAIVVEVGKTKFAALDQASNVLHQTNAHIFGVILNRFKTGRLGYYQNYYYYSKNYYAHDVSKKSNDRSKLPTWLSGLSKR